MNRRRFSAYRIEDKGEKGKSVIANRKFSAGETAIIGRLVRLTQIRTNHSFQLDWNVHADLDEPASLVNHSCDPNCGVRRNVFGGYDLVAMRDILSGEEICWDYCMTEYISIAVNYCRCGSQHCRKTIRGWKYLSVRLKKRYGTVCAPYLLTKNGVSNSFLSDSEVLYYFLR